jgi:hypothetical protein
MCIILIVTLKANATLDREVWAWTPLITIRTADVINQATEAKER